MEERGGSTGMAKEAVYTTLEGGGILWNASGVLGDYLAAKRKEDIVGKNVLEVCPPLPSRLRTDAAAARAAGGQGG